MGKSRISSVISGLIDLILAGFYWLICSLPVITLGASSTALYYTVVKCVRHERGMASKSFFQTFAREFKQSTLVWLLYLAYVLVGAADAWAIELMGQGTGSVLGVLRWLFFLPALLSLPWVFAYISRFDNNVKGTLKFVGWLTMKNIGVSLLMTLELGAAAVITWLTPMLLPLLPGAVCMLLSLHIEPVFRTFTAEQGGENEDTWYNE